jgi:hypothetical protein
MAETARVGDERNVWRTAMRGYALGFVVAMCGIAAAGTLGGLGLGPSLGFGAFIGVFGGGGFGFMTAASMALAHDIDAGPLTHRQQGETRDTAAR